MQGLPRAVDLRFCLDSVCEALNGNDTRVLDDAHLRGDAFWNAIDAVGEIPLAAHEEIPDGLHSNDARGSSCGSANRPVQAGFEDAAENLRGADSLEIGGAIFVVQGPAEIAAAMCKGPGVPYEIESESQRGKAVAP